MKIFEITYESAEGTMVLIVLAPDIVEAGVAFKKWGGSGGTRPTKLEERAFLVDSGGKVEMAAWAVQVEVKK